MTDFLSEHLPNALISYLPLVAFILAIFAFIAGTRFLFVRNEALKKWASDARTEVWVWRLLIILAFAAVVTGAVIPDNVLAELFIGLTSIVFSAIATGLISVREIENRAVKKESEKVRGVAVIATRSLNDLRASIARLGKTWEKIADQNSIDRTTKIAVKDTIDNIIAEVNSQKGTMISFNKEDSNPYGLPDFRTSTICAYKSCRKRVSIEEFLARHPGAYRRTFCAECAQSVQYSRAEDGRVYCIALHEDNALVSELPEVPSTSKSNKNGPDSSHGPEVVGSKPLGAAPSQPSGSPNAVPRSSTVRVKAPQLGINPSSRREKLLYEGIVCPNSECKRLITTIVDLRFKSSKRGCIHCNSNFIFNNTNGEVVSVFENKNNKAALQEDIIIVNNARRILCNCGFYIKSEHFEKNAEGIFASNCFRCGAVIQASVEILWNVPPVGDDTS